MCEIEVNKKKLVFLARSQPLSWSFQRIDHIMESIENRFSVKKMFGKAIPESGVEATLEALPNKRENKPSFSWTLCA